MGKIFLAYWTLPGLLQGPGKGLQCNVYNDDKAINQITLLVSEESER